MVTKQNELSPEEQQYLKDMGNDDGFWRFPAYSSSVTPSELLAKLERQFEAVPSYVDRFKNGQEQTV